MLQNHEAPAQTAHPIGCIDVSSLSQQQRHHVDVAEFRHQVECGALPLIPGVDLIGGLAEQQTHDGRVAALSRQVQRNRTLCIVWQLARVCKPFNVQYSITQ